MSLITRGGSVILGQFGLRSDTIPERAAPAATVVQHYAHNEDQTYLLVEITGAVSGATGYSVVVVNAGTLATVASATIAGDAVVAVGPLPAVSASTPLLYRISANPAGLALQGAITQTVITALAEDDPPVLAATRVGDAFALTPPVWTVVPTSEAYVIEEDADGAGAGTAIVPTPTHVPGGGAGKYYRVVYTAYGPAGDGPVTSASAYDGPMTAAPSLAKLTTSTAVMGASFYWPTTGQTTWAKVPFTFPGASGSVFEWTTTDPLAYPNDHADIHWKPFESQGGGVYWPVDVSTAADPTTGRPANYSVWRFNPDSGDLAKLRVRQGDGLGGWSPISLPSWTIQQPAGTPPSTDAAWRDVRLRAAAQLGVTPDNADLFTRGILSGGAGQWMTCAAWSADGSKVGVGQDSGQFLFSPNAGRTWHRPRGQGCKLSMVKGIAADPANTSRWFAVVTGRTGQDAALAGVYVTADDFATMSRVKAIDDVQGAQLATDAFSCYPATGGATSRWYVAFNRGAGSTNGAFCKSGTDNGTTWGTTVSLGGTFGRIYTLKASPHTSALLFLGTGNGLFCTENGNATTPTWNELPGNLPAGPVRSFWIDPLNGSHMLATLSTTASGTYGLYETNNATAATPSWTRIRECPAHWLAVGSLSGGARTVYVRCGSTGTGTTTSNDTDHIRLRSGTWITRATAAPNRINLNFAGAQSNLMPFNGLCDSNILGEGGGQRHTWVHAHPTDEDTFIIHGKTSMLRTVDQGLNVNCGGYDGMQWRDAYYDLTDRDVIVGAFHDTGMAYSADGHLSHYQIRFTGFKPRVETVFGAEIHSFSGLSVTQLPNNSSVDKVDWRGRIIGGAGSTTSTQGCIFYVNKGATAMLDHMGTPSQGQSNATGGGWATRFSTGFLRHNPNKAWCGPNIVTLTAGAGTWGVSSGSRGLIGAAQDGTDTTYSWSGQTIGRATTWGGAWTTIHTFTGSNILDNSAPVGCCSAYDGRRIFLKHGPRTFKMLFDNGTASADVTTFNLEGTLVFDSPYAYDAGIESICGDVLDERYVYVGTGTVGTAKRVFRGKFNAAFTSITWENLTANSGYGAIGIDVFPTGLHGCVQAGHYGLGSFVWPSPSDWAPRVGWYGFSGQPSNGQTLTVNGVTWTFVTSGAGTAQTNIGANLSATLTALATGLNASANASITPCTYTARYGTRLEVTMDDPTQGVDEPFPLTKGTTANATVYDNVVPCKDRMWLDLALPVRAT